MDVNLIRLYRNTGRYILSCHITNYNLHIAIKWHSINADGVSNRVGVKGTM